MEYSQGFKARMIQRMSGPEAISAGALSREVGVAQSTLSGWRRQAATILAMSQNDKTDKAGLPPDKRPTEEKFRIVMEAARLSDEELGAFLRREGVHESHLQSWRTEMLEAFKSAAQPPRGRRRSAADTKRIKALERELKRKDKALAETAALLVLQKKVQALWEDEDNGTSGSSGA